MPSWDGLKRPPLLSGMPWWSVVAAAAAGQAIKLGRTPFFFLKAGEPLRLLAGTRTWLLAKLGFQPLVSNNQQKQEPKPLSFLEKWELFGGL